MEVVIPDSLHFLEAMRVLVRHLVPHYTNLQVNLVVLESILDCLQLPELDR